MKAIAAAVVVAAAILPAACGHGDTENKANVEQPAPTVIVQTVRQGTVPITEDFQGTIGAVESVEIRARVPGVLEQAPFKEGDLVRQGDVIFQIQQNEYVAALRTAQAQLATARAQGAQARGNLFSRQAALARANTTVARNRPLAADKAIPQKELDNAIQNAEIARGDVDVARAGIESASAAMLAGQAAVDNAQINLGYTTIRAPVTGLIGFSNFDVGNVVGGPGTQVLNTISSIDPVKITFGLDEPTYLALARTRGTENGTSLRGQALQVVLANDSTYPYTGSVYAISPTIDPKTGTVTVEARFPNSEGLLRPGGFARVRVTVERRRDAVLVPQTAIVKSQGVDTVYVIDSKNVAALRTVTLGPQYQQSFIVQSGLKAGERVVTEGTQKVQPDEKVVVKGG